MSNEKKLSSAVAGAVSTFANPYGLAMSGSSIIATNVEVPGSSLLQTMTSIDTDVSNVPHTYYQEIQQCQFFYRYDPIASTVVNRMVDMSVGTLLNRRYSCSNEESAYYQGVATHITPIIKSFALEYLLSGMVIADYTMTRKRGDLINPNLGRTRYTVPDSIWVRNPENIVLKRMPTGIKRAVYLRVPNEEVSFIQRNHTSPNDQPEEEQEIYLELKRNFPEYVQMIIEGRKIIPLNHIRPILRKPLTNSDWPQPFLVPALASLKHKWRIKAMDYSIATRALEAVQHIRAGNDEYPVEEGDPTLKQIEETLNKRNIYGNTRDIIYKLFTNHTVEIEWIYPPMDTLLSDTKYAEPNSDILMAMGFSRVLLVGESLRSNSGQSTTTTLGPIATLNEMRASILEWVEGLYNEMREYNNFKRMPKPYFPPINSADKLELAKYAIDAAKIGAISKDAVAFFFDRDYTSEREQMDGFEDNSSNIVEDKLPADKQQEQFINNTTEEEK